MDHAIFGRAVASFEFERLMMNLGGNSGFRCQR
jgi:hypothetical protein